MIWFRILLAFSLALFVYSTTTTTTTTTTTAVKTAENEEFKKFIWEAYYATCPKDLLRELLAESTNEETKNVLLEKLFTTSLQADNFYCFTFLLDNGVFFKTVSFSESEPIPVLHAAIEKVSKYFGFTEIFGHKDVRLQTIKLLIQNGVDIDAKNKENETPLMIAVSYRNLPLVKLLVKSGASLNSVNSHNENCLFYLYKRGELYGSKIFKFLISAGVDYHVKNRDGVPVHFLVAAYGTYGCWKLLLSKPDSANLINSVDKFGNTILIYMAKNSVDYLDTRNLDKIVKDIIDMKVNLNIQNDEKRTALAEALISSDLDLANLLIDYDVFLNSVDVDGNSILHLLWLNRKLGAIYSVDKFTKDLIRMGANYKIRNNKGKTIFDYLTQDSKVPYLVEQLAAENGDVEALQLILPALRRNPKFIANEMRDSPIVTAARRGHFDAVHWFAVNRPHQVTVGTITQIENFSALHNFPIYVLDRVKFALAFRYAKEGEVIHLIELLETFEGHFDIDEYDPADGRTLFMKLVASTASLQELKDFIRSYKPNVRLHSTFGKDLPGIAEERMDQNREIPFFLRGLIEKTRPQPAVKEKIGISSKFSHLFPKKK